MRAGRWAENRFGVLFDLLGKLKILVVNPKIVVFALFCRVFPTNVRANVVYAAKIVIPKMLTRRVNEQIPIVFLDEHARMLVQQKPTHIIELLPGIRLVDGQREIAAAFRVAIGTENFVFPEVFASGAFLRH